MKKHHTSCTKLRASSPEPAQYYISPRQTQDVKQADFEVLTDIILLTEKQPLNEGMYLERELNKWFILHNPLVFVKRNISSTLKHQLISAKKIMLLYLAKATVN